MSSKNSKCSFNNRLTKLIDNQLSNSQFGFRENHRTADSIFILKSLINKYIHKNKGKIYACFVDLRKAFDSVWREALLYKLSIMGVGSKFFNIIKEQYNITNSSLKFKDKHSVFFNIIRGVKQGDSLSPTLFNIFINDIAGNFNEDQSYPLKLIESQIGSLLFADDLLILSESKEGLQNSLNNLSKYCDTWQLNVNINKTKSMIFKQRNLRPEPSFVTYKNEVIENVADYTFLGILLKSNGNLLHSTSELVKKAKKALFGMRHYTKSINNLPINVACNLFDLLVKPIMTYNSEITYVDTYISYYRAKNRANRSGRIVNQLDFIDKNPIENTHLAFCKNMLGVRKSAANIASRLELQRLPIESYIKTQSVLYFTRLFAEELNPLLKESFTLSKNLDSTGIYTWYSYAMDIIKETNIDTDRLYCRNNNKINLNRNYIKQSIKNYYENLINEKISSIDESSKLFLYKHLKPNENPQNYLFTLNSEYRTLIAKLRMSDHNLMIERGRHLKLAREERLCTLCNLVDDEKHFLLECKYNSDIRSLFLDFIIEENSEFRDLSLQDKTLHILNPSTSSQVNRLGSFIKKSLALRTGDS